MNRTPKLPLQYPPVNFGLLELLRTDPLVFVMLAVSLLGAIALHEYAHALAADLQGDRMPRAMGRLTLNPLRHLDPLGTVAIFLVGFGWGRPVEFRPQALSSKRFGAAFVALAGPGMNLLLAIVGVIFAKVAGFDLAGIQAFTRAPGSNLELFLFLFVTINVVLAVFNMIPLPPLDGSRLLTIFLPPHRQNVIYFLDQYGFLILLALVFLGGLAFLSPIIDSVSSAVFSLAGL